MYMKVSEQVFIRRTSRGNYILQGDHVIEINGISEEILSLCNGTKTSEEILHELCRLHGEHVEDVRGDFEQFVRDLREYSILEYSDAPEYIDPLYHYDRPYSINIEITYACNQNCVFCAADAGIPLRNELTQEEIDTLLDEIIELHINPITITGGEPLLKYDILLHMVERIASAGLKPITLTNATLITEEMADTLYAAGLHTIQTSVDGLTPEVHNKIRGTCNALDDVKRGIAIFKKAGFEVHVSTVLNRQNFCQLGDILAIENLFGADRTYVSFVHPLGRGKDEKFHLTPKQVRDYFVLSHMTDTGEILNEFIPRERCSIGTSPVITPAGDVYPCMLTKFEPLKLGNVRKTALKEIWQNSPLLKELLACSVHKLEPCRACKFRFYCGGGCRGAAFAYHGTIYKNDPYTCKATRLIVKELRERGTKDTKERYRMLCEEVNV
jgi:radical SAM protein with 4Fe4S-binding SPASM domain